MGKINNTWGKLEIHDYIVKIIQCLDLRDLGVSNSKDFLGQLAKDPGDQVNVMHRTIMEDATRDLEVLQRGQRRVAACGLNDLDMANLTC